MTLTTGDFVDERRLFRRSEERTQIFAAAAGRCVLCGKELDPGWHADHRHPHSKDGPTEVWNGQALCPECDAKKGAQVNSGLLELRPFQEELMEVTASRIRDAQPVTVGWIETGSGKTRGWQLTANHLAESGEIDYVAVYAPRLNLCEQADIDWQIFDHEIGGAGLLRVGHAINQDPLRPNDMGGFISTYQAAVANPQRHLSQAQRDHGRFLLVLDEAQTCGYGEDGGGTEAGRFMRELAAHARHTLIITGTPYRADHERIALCEYTAPDEHGKVHLVWHVRATYREGVAREYLRPFEFKLRDGAGQWKRSGQKFAVSELEEQLKAALQHEDVWAPLVDDTMEILRERQTVDMRYRALISCMDTRQAEDVLQYLRRHHPDLPAVKAVHKDGVGAGRTLRSFRQGDRHLVLVTVRMAFIGYDCKAITVVGVLTHYRWDGHLRQITGRGLRMWNQRPVEEQYCYIVGPDDPRLAAFAKRMREESEQGLRERRREEGGPLPPPGESDEVLEAEMHDARAFGWHGEIDDPDEVGAIEAARQASGIRESATRLKSFLQAMKERPRTSGDARDARHKTRREEIEDLRAKNMALAREIASRRIRLGLGTDFGETIRQVIKEAHGHDGLGFSTNGALNTESALKRRGETLERMRGPQ